MAQNMYDDLGEILLDAAAIEKRVKELGQEIAKAYEGKELVVVGILKGAVVFYADLIRALPIPLTLDFMAISSYGAATSSSGVVRINKDLDRDIVGKHVLLVEDIIDTGLTLSYLRETLLARGAASLGICALLDKAARRKTDIQGDYIGFTIPDAFVVGYGLDYNEKYRNLPDIGVLKPSIYQD